MGAIMTVNMIKAVFLDFDGTLYSHRAGQIPGSALKAIRMAREKGILVFLCTGRAKAELKDFDLTGLETDGMILVNGQVFYGPNGKVLFEHPIEGILKEKILDLYNRKEAPVYLVTPEENILNFVNDTIIRVQNQVSSGMPPVRDYQGEPVYMASAFADEKTMKTIVEELGEETEITWWTPEAIDILPKGVFKTNGIDEVLSLYGISLSETLAIGDGENDRKMIEHCAIGIAMGNAADDLKQAAGDVTDDIDENGLYKAFIRYGLIQEAL